MKFMRMLLMAVLAIFSISVMAQDTTKQNKMQSKKQIEKPMYTCPMHADVLSDKPGKCPKCGMDLVKKEKKSVLYTCPMHAEVTSDKPGKCPKCGMELKAKKEK